MAESSSKNPKEPLPFTMYRNHIEMMGRIVESQCKLGMMMLNAGAKPAASTAKTAPKVADVALKDFIPSTDDLQVAAKAVTKAMNEAAVRAIAHASGTKADDDDNGAVPDQPKPAFKPSISAAKKPVAKKPAAKKPTVSAAAARKSTATKASRARAAKA